MLGIISSSRAQGIHYRTINTIKVKRKTFIVLAHKQLLSVLVYQDIILHAKSQVKLIAIQKKSHWIPAIKSQVFGMIISKETTLAI